MLTGKGSLPVSVAFAVALFIPAHFFDNALRKSFFLPILIACFLLFAPSGFVAALVEALLMLLMTFLDLTFFPGKAPFLTNLAGTLLSCFLMDLLLAFQAPHVALKHFPWRAGDRLRSRRLFPEELLFFLPGEKLVFDLGYPAPIFFPKTRH